MTIQRGTVVPKNPNHGFSLPAKCSLPAPTGAAAVIGAGITGMQAALDLAEAGIKVYLLDRAPAIGGTMAMLDKTFPTNDCAMCIISPRLVEVGRHLNIEIVDCAEVTSLEGEPGNFTLTVRQHPRFVDRQKCTGCGDCATACPVILPDAFNGGLSTRKAIYKLYPQAIPNAYAIEKHGMAPCRDACPIHQRTQGYVALVAAGRYADAYRTILQENPFPSICGRVCNHRCEEACNRGLVDSAVNLKDLKRFVADWAWEHAEQVVGAERMYRMGTSDTSEPFRDVGAGLHAHPAADAAELPFRNVGLTAHPTSDALAGKRVAVVGSGPAGLTCAQDLRRLGCAVTIYEALPIPGGMLRVGLPAHRLPPEVVQREIDAILAQGIELKLNQRIDGVETLLNEFDAVFVAIGAHGGVRLPIPGSQLPTVLLATEFLREVGLHKAAAAAYPAERMLRMYSSDPSDPSEPFRDKEQRPETTGNSIPRSGCTHPNHSAMVAGKRVLVLGGGNVAIDTAMTAVRLGAAWVGMTCLESREKMPAHAWEIRETEEEGIEVFPSRTFKEIVELDGNVSGVRTVQVDFRGFVDGRPDFDELPGTEQVIPAQVVIFAVGQRPESDCFKQARLGRGGRVEVDPETLATSILGIFAGGDAVTGTTFIVDAIAAGHRAGWAIAAYLGIENSTDVPIRNEQTLKVLETSRVCITKGKEQIAGGNGDGSELPFCVVRLSRAEVEAAIAASSASAHARNYESVLPASERKISFVEFHHGLTEAQAQAEAARCLRCGVCSECNQCAYACRAGAIRHDDFEQSLTLDVGAVVLSPGVETMPGGVRPEYGYGRFPNVVTSLQFERMLSASGPFAGVVSRPSDGVHPHKVAWIQCVGSRDCSDASAKGERGEYCSSVCCMVATKEAMIAREHDAQIKPTIFYMDIRSYGKGFDAYIERAKNEHRQNPSEGIRYIRCLVSSIKEVPGSHNLRLRYINYEAVPKVENGGEKRPRALEEEFDLVVLSVGLKPTAEAKETAQRLGVRLNEYGFIETISQFPTRTSRPGVFAAGTFTEPKDIPESVVEASCAAAQVSELLHDARGKLTLTPIYPEERDIDNEVPRVGVFVCHCGINIGAVVNTAKVVEYAQSLPGVAYAEHNLYTCSQDTQARISAKILEHGLNRVVVASCTPRTHEPLFQDTLRQSGLNPHLFEMANIREQDSWVHRSSPGNATEKAMQLVSMAVGKARRLSTITRSSFQVDPKALVIGGGLAGLSAALSIARQGFGVYLVEREAELGGNLRHIYTSLPGGPGGFCPPDSLNPPDGFHPPDPQALLQGLVQAVMDEPLIQVMVKSELVELTGFTGQFRSLVRGAGDSPGANWEITHGAIVVATGGRELSTSQYLLGQAQRVLTQRQLEKRLLEPDFIDSLAGNEDSLPARCSSPATIVMIQCVGSREADHPYCSRVCCTEALKNALYIKTRAPKAKVIILYRDLRSYGFREHWYHAARRSGVIFLEYDRELPPDVQVTQDEQQHAELHLKVAVQPENSQLHLKPDWLVLSVGIEPEQGNNALARLLKVPLNEDGFFLEAHVKLRPVDFAAEGIFLCGLAHSPRDMQETIAQAQAAAVRAVALLSKPQLEAIPITASVNPKRCAACGLCVEVCPYGARRLEPDMAHAEVIEVLCQGCGACVAACPNKACEQKGFSLDQELAMIEATLA